MRNTNSWGVVPMRLQVPDLHNGHRALLEKALTENAHVLVYLGVTETKLTNNDPLDYATREYMLQATYPQIIIVPDPVYRHHEYWNQAFDASITEKTNGGEVTLYGSRDSFLKTYNGKFKISFFEEVKHISGTLTRESICQEFPKTFEGRRGVIYASEHKFPTAYPTVDIAVLESDFSSIILGRKKGEKKFRFIGGFFDPTKDESYESAAARELHEECPGIAVDGISSFKYVTSRKQDDWRYRKTKDCVTTTLFYTVRQWGYLKAGDDIEQVERFPFILETIENMVEEHQELYRILFTKLQKQIHNENKEA